MVIIFLRYAGVAGVGELLHRHRRGLAGGQFFVIKRRWPNIPKTSIVDASSCTVSMFSFLGLLGVGGGVSTPGCFIAKKVLGYRGLAHLVLLVHFTGADMWSPLNISKRILSSA